MIKRNGDWTGKLIEKLYEAKKKILRVNHVKVKGFDEEDVFTLLQDMNDQHELKSFNHNLFPKIHISRPITSPAESAVYHKNLILIGMGSGIAPYLSLVEEQSNLLDDICSLSKKKTIRAFE